MIFYRWFKLCYFTSLFEQQQRTAGFKSSLEIDSDMMKDYALKQFNIRKSKVDRAQKYQNAAELEAAAAREV